MAHFRPVLWIGIDCVTLASAKSLSPKVATIIQIPQYQPRRPDMKSKSLKYARAILEPARNGKLSHALSNKLWAGYSYLNQIHLHNPDTRDHTKQNILPMQSDKYGSAYFYHQLTNHILPFWKDNALDTHHGGYIVHLSENGERYESSSKSTAMHARMVYAFSVGYQIQQDSHYLKCADHGVRFMIDHLWDKQYGGWYRTVTRKGVVKVANKHGFDNAYALIGLSKYYGVTKSPEILHYINDTYELLESYARDNVHGGYYKVCTRDWIILNNKKTACIHLDMLAAALSLHKELGTDKCVNSINQIANIITEKIMDLTYSSLLEVFYPDWRYNPLANNNRIEFGHNLKGAWMLLKAYEVTGMKQHYETARKLVDFSIQYGWDQEVGGFFQHAFRNGMLASDEKLWWPECEGILALLRLHLVSGDDRYLSYFHKLITFIEHSFNDATHGDWFTSVTRDGEPINRNKGGNYKAAFHIVEAYFHAYQELMTHEKSLNKTSISNRKT